MRLLEIADIKQLVHKVGLKAFYVGLIDCLKADFAAWHSFQKSPRHANYVQNGVIELMPICGESLFSFKYVNGHPNNPVQNKLTVVACGMLTDVKTGYPLLISEMTLLTAIRTGATAALASYYLAKANSKVLAIIGCGAQSEFQVLAHHALLGLSEVRYYDLDAKAMQRFAHNLKSESFKRVPGVDIQSMIQGADIIVTATARPGKHQVLKLDWLLPGQHICGIGGDSPDKTELDPEILRHSKVVIEYFPQSHHEGEIQNLGAEAQSKVYAELWELVAGKKPGREGEHELTVYDSVGFALEDYSVLRYVLSLATAHQVGTMPHLVPEGLVDCKNLYGLLLD